MLKKYIKILAFLTAISGCSEDSIVNNQEEDISYSDLSTEIVSIVESVNADSVINNLEVLTGIKPFIKDRDTILIQTRHSTYNGNEYAADYLIAKMNEYGYDVSEQTFNEKGRNIYAVHEGSKRPDEYYIICAHYDSRPESIIGPGADDNGSGTAAVLEAARVFADLKPETSIIFAFWDEEEQGLFGSKHFAEIAKNSYMKIISVINIDMIGWDSNNDNYLMLAVNDVDKEYPFLSYAYEINNGMDLGLNLGIIQAMSSSSDHLSFLSSGFNAYCIIEDKQDFNGFYHTSNDILEFINKEYLIKNIRLSTGILAMLTLQ